MCQYSGHCSFLVVSLGIIAVCANAETKHQLVVYSPAKIQRPQGCCCSDVRHSDVVSVLLTISA